MTDSNGDDVSTPDCSLADRDRRIAGYIAGTLPADEAEGFEAHYFGCDSCWREVRMGIEIRAAATLPNAAPVVIHPAIVAPRKIQPWRWVPLAAAAGVILAAGLTIWFQGSSAPTPETTAALAPAPQKAEPASMPTQSPAASAPGKQPTSKPPVAIAVLAQVKAPTYLPGTLRGPRDEAVQRFEAGMGRYVEKDFAGAIPDLEASVRLHADAPNANFFLAICRLLTGDVASAVEGLQTTIALGESPYLEEAHFYLAKARLSQARLTDASDELTRTIARRGRLEREARDLLVEVNKHIEGTGR